MKIGNTGAGRPGVSWTKIGAMMVLACLFCTPANFGTAQTAVALQATPMIVRNDRGGRLLVRLRQIAKLRQSHRPVEISGGLCYSTCTMYLGLPQTCISPQTTFGFHGPTSYGRPLDQATFDHASTVIANHYPPALRRWYMREGRYQTRGMYKIRGRHLIEMGIKAC